MKAERRGSWYLLTGIILGAAVGLLYSWQVSPVKYVDAPPSALRTGYKDEYRALIAMAYLYSNDLLRAEQRLALLEDENPIQALTVQAQQARAQGLPIQQVQALNALALALSSAGTPAAAPVSPAPLPTPTPAGQDSPPVP